ncbi:MAG: hypothetical protein LBJ46_04135 [Planctomycetota bacterium]|jgi:two-component system sensor histidine kinase PilS (NtrC family)|nr:hypothetical protein [Planctomycetota bacterium]
MIVHGSTGQILKFRALVVVRSLLYLMAIGFIIQRLFFHGDSGLYGPKVVAGALFVVLAVNISLIPLMTSGGRMNLFMAALFVSDIAAITCVVLASGGFRSLFVTYYLLILVIASLWLPRRYTALFPSVATLGLAAVGAVHILANQQESAPGPLPREFAAMMRDVGFSAAVSDMLLLALLFFIVAYLAGVVGDSLTLEQRLNSAILGNMGEGVAFVDHRGRIMYRNAEFDRLFPEADAAVDLDGLSMGMFGTASNRSPLAGLVAGKAGESFILTTEADDASGRPPAEIRATRLSLDGGPRRIGLFLLVIDLSPRLRMAAAEKSVERFSAISMMAAGLAHEIRNPLASVRSAVQELMASFPGDSQERVLADLVLSESDRLDGIITRFLSFSRDEPLSLAPTHIGEILREVRALLVRRDEAFMVRVELDVGEDPEVICDADRLKEVFLNLGLNALQLARGDDPALEIGMRRSVFHLLPGVSVVFADNGPGIDPDDLPDVFQPFYSRRRGGTGMGLALARKQVEAHGGTIMAANRPSGGAEFTVWLPLTAQDSFVKGRTARRSVTRIHRYKE